ncbi:MAG: DUF5131 family protein [Pseudonocardiales bacterium]
MGDKSSIEWTEAARVSDEFILRVLAVMQVTPRHAYQMLTKRSPWPRNVWMGVSVEDDDHVRRVDDLRHVPAAVRFISAEPLLAPLPSLDLRYLPAFTTASKNKAPSTVCLDPVVVAQDRTRHLKGNRAEGRSGRTALLHPAALL